MSLETIERALSDLITTRVEIEKFRQNFGLAGPPAYKVEALRGRVSSTCYVLEAEADNMAFSGRFGAASLAHDLPVRVHGVNRDWTCVIVDLRTGSWRPVGTAPNMPGVTPSQHAAAAHVALDLSDGAEVWIGNPVLIDTDSLRLSVFTDGCGKFSLEVHNPTGRTVDAQLSANTGCPLFTFQPMPIRLGPKSTLVLNVP
jgi:hypothetical protein